MSESFDEPRAGQEAAKLLAAAQDWLRTSAPHVAPLDAEGRTCACPLCRIVEGVRDTDPVALGTWVDAAVAAATSALAQAGETLAPPSPASADEDAARPASPGRGSEGDDGPDGADADLVDLVDDLPDEDLEVDGASRAEHHEAGARQDEDRARGVRRIPLEQTEPGDLDG